tara:strand:+ start:90 stop:422 length:333 start_codon:yes stop_codon:yes gene_type:complete
MIGISKASQLKKNKEPKFNYAKYAKWIHSNDKCCVICGDANIEVHHLTDINKIHGARRDDRRVVTLCKNHHKESKFGIHIMAKEDFYLNVMDLDTLLFHAKLLLEEYENE